MRIGIDVGGTFTDIVAIDDATGRITVKKTYTTPSELSQGVIDGIEKLLAFLKVPRSAVGLLIHGTTVGTNALIERKGAKTGLLTTDGFRDVLEIGRIQRPPEALYDFTVDNPPPLVPRYLRLGAKERIDSSGNVVIPLDEESVRRAGETFKREGVESIAISFLFSFLNSHHEKQAREIIKEILPDAYVSISSDIVPEFREYERTSTVVISAYLQPIVERYVERLGKRLKECYPNIDLRLIQANGGSTTPEGVKGKAINLVNSGPAGGATGAAFIGKLIGREKLVSIDMGGTSFDISLVEEGLAKVTTDNKFEGYPIKIAMDDVNIIGAGGGSIAWIDKGGALNVGPQSSSAMPGPACYGRGGEEPTVTDANVVLGRISPNYFLGGEIKLHLEYAKSAIVKKICSKTGLSLEEGAAGIIRVVNANMSKAISVKSIQKGYDLREFSLIAFGGAGPLHAVDIAEDLGIGEVIIPMYPGAFSAFGLLVADTRHDYTQTIMCSEDKIKPSELLGIWKELERKGISALESDHIPPESRIIQWSADLRFEGQSYELNIPVQRKEGLHDLDIKKLFVDFAKEHEKIYSFKAIDEKSIIVNIRVTAIGKSPKIIVEKLRGGDKDSSKALKGKRKVFFEDVGFIETKIYERNSLTAGNVVEGPAVVEEAISCTVIKPGKVATIDSLGNIMIKV